MRVHIGSIRKSRGETLHVAFKKRVPSPIDSGEDSLQVGVDAEVTNSGRSYRVKGEIRTTLDLFCDRCLAPIKRPVVIHFEEDFRQRGQRGPRGQEDSIWTYEGDAMESGEQDASSVALNSDETDTLFDGDVFTLDDVVRDYLMVEVPVKAVCHEDCRGICPQCGQNMNESECSCRQEAIDPRLAGLADFLTEQE